MTQTPTRALALRVYGWGTLILGTDSAVHKRITTMSPTGDSDAFKVSDANTLTETNNADKVNFKRKFFVVVAYVILLTTVIWYSRPPISSVSNNIHNLTELPNYPYTLSVLFRDWFEELNRAIELWNIRDNNYWARIEHFYPVLSNHLLTKVMPSQSKLNKVSVSADPYKELRDTARELSESIEKLEHLRLLECLFRESVYYYKVYPISKKAPYSIIHQSEISIFISYIFVGMLLAIALILITDSRLRMRINDKTTCKSCI